VTSALEACDPQKGAKLIDFYVSSSHQSCHIPHSYGNYVSVEMLKTVLVAGARLVDFDIHAQLTPAGEIIPVVRSNWKKRISQNYVLLDDVWDTISNHGFSNKYGDPLLIHLNLKTSNIGVIDKIAKSFVQYIDGTHILEPRFSYHSQKSIAKEPICTLLNKAIIIVTGDCSHTHLDELVNLHTSHNARLLEAKEVRAPADPRALAFSNQHTFTLVRPEPYDLNTNPEDAWTYGCHAFMMNFWNYSKLIKSHCDFFKKSSFIMKKFELQQEQHETKPIESSKLFKKDTIKTETISTN
jgi:hypothetical protein